MSSQVQQCRAIWVAAQARCPAPPAACLFRITEGFNVETVEAHGTDRAGRDREMAWSTRGYVGRERAFAEVIFASTADEIEASLRGERARSAITKIPSTPDAHLLIYTRDALEAVHTEQYAFVRGVSPRSALLAIVPIAELVGLRAPSGISARGGAPDGRGPAG